jgi:light-regulated signal transduction histidine kinase (bacteriophytochrome)
MSIELLNELTPEQQTIQLLQDELAATNHEVMLLTLELEQRVAVRTAELSDANRDLLREIAEHKRAEEKIQSLNEDLRRRAVLLEEMNADLDAFTSSVSHDLRAPLRRISGFIGLIESDEGNVLSEDGRQKLERVQTITSMMATLIDELLRFSRSSREQLKLETVDLNAMVDRVVAELHDEAPGRVVEWKRQTLPMVEGDASLLLQVFVNLISNALKYSRPRNPAVIEIGSKAGSAETVFFVRDNGVGFDPRYADKLFGVFQRLHNERDFEGTGIGLANVRRIVSRHRGKTWAEGCPNAGATFFFSLPSAHRSEQIK